MHFSKSYFVIGVRMPKLYYDTKVHSKEALAAERAERKAVVAATKSIPACKKRFKTQKQAAAALEKLVVPANVRFWLDVVEQSDLYL